jgi:hypothetical protein
MWKQPIKRDVGRGKTMSKHEAEDWLAEPELAELTGISTELLRRGAASGLFEGLMQMVNGERRYAPDTVTFVAWSDRLGDDVVSGVLTLREARRMLRSRARQLQRRIRSKISA